MDNNFDPIQFGASLSNILTNMASTNYSSIDPVVSELKTDSIESALLLLESRLKYFSSCNFHPISASITKILAFSYKMQNKYENFIIYGFRCISPLYQRFLSTDIQKVFLQNIPLCPQCSVDITTVSSIPFDISAGFNDLSSSPSDDVSFFISIRSLLEQEINFDSISVTINHTKDPSSTYKIVDGATLQRHQRIKQSALLPIHRPGVLSINSITIKINEILLNVKSFKEIGYGKTSIRPFDTECKFDLIYPAFGVTGIEYPLQIKCDNIPEGAESFTIETSMNSEPAVASFVGIDTLKYQETYEKPSKLIEKTLKIISPSKCNLNVSVQWSLLYETVNTTHEKTFSAAFTDSFATSFKLFNSDRSPISLKSAPVLSADQKYILVATFEYNLPVQSTIMELQPKAAENVKLDQIIFDVPLDILTSEAFTSVCYLTFDESAKSGPLGTYNMKYKVHGSSDLFNFVINLPSVSIKEKCVDVSIDMPNEVIENAENKLEIKIRGLNQVVAVLDVGANDDFQISTNFKKNINLQPNETDAIPIVFVPKKPGKINLHLFLVDQNEIVLWESDITADAKPAPPPVPEQ